MAYGRGKNGNCSVHEKQNRNSRCYRNGYPGSVHDNRINENSDVYSQLPNLCGSFFLLGDSAYACSQYLITPYRDNGHLSSGQTFFNWKLSSGRIVIEHSFGLLKQGFR